ncbi:heterokaryon incompatibility protein-domain-containing protein [Dactylonectria macrodidyma]|uniref:Heterokaryon incompatibility protein-domain-containing protein n=1 Tax=Dactylonectria macrodidyma TaxID=307937 RepID=A0A9P9E1S8_9HYPO|nr:heterokaryon incompatibility protein-domain-containing protein [Dactylonectria macrodidyma]
MATPSLARSWSRHHQQAQDPASMVCSKCWEVCFSTEGFRELCRADIGGGSRVVYEIDGSYTAKNALKGCVWCSLIQRLDTASGDIVPLEFRRDTSIIKVRVGPGFPYENFTPKGNNRLGVTVNGSTCYFTAIATEHSPVSDIVTARPLHTDVTSELTFKAIDQWLEKCDTHPECEALSDSPLPTRLIDVASEDQKARIASTKGLWGRYAALSYCWGGAQSGKTLRATFAARQHRIEPAELSKTVRQAIQTTRRMGLQYVWIDAICIIQDDETDRANEIAQMCDIYRRAYVTIVAATAASSSDGFLQVRPRPSPLADMPFWTTNKELSSVSLILEGWYDDSSEPINTRCWTLQERLLSRRLVIFASHTIQLQCQHEIVNLGDSINLPTGLGSWRLPSSLLRPLPFANVEASNLGREAIIELWKGAITMYSERQIKRRGERLVALSGLAHAFHQALNLRYLAGLWCGPTLPFMLLWEAGNYVPPVDQTYVAPTWSWASHSGPVSYRNAYNLSTMRIFDMEMLSATTELQDIALPFGKVTSGKVVLKGRAKQARFNPSGDLVFMEYSGSPPRRPSLPPSGIYPPNYILPDFRTHAKLDSETTFQAMDVVSLAVVSRTYELDGVQYTAVDGLLLQRTEGRGIPTEYRRIGCFYGAMQQEFFKYERVEVALV